MGIICLLGVNNIRTGGSGTKFDFSAIPLNLGNWKGKELKVPDYIYEMLETNTVYRIQYANDSGKEIYFSIVVSDFNNAQFHPPEVCMLGNSKVEILEKEKITIPLAGKTDLTVNKLVINQKKPDSSSKMIYWFMTKDKTFSSFYLHQLNLLLNIITGKRYLGGVIRIVVDDTNGNNEAFLNEFISLIFPHLNALF
ncbi:MAG: hypothetical protein ACD_79C01059G0002 [uncultured bacterium]|nr:MAG: hypothetical protein ACD_79C01059G0002 [uncultured bacterium]